MTVQKMCLFLAIIVQMVHCQRDTFVFGNYCADGALSEGHVCFWRLLCRWCTIRGTRLFLAIIVQMVHYQRDTFVFGNYCADGALSEGHIERLLVDTRAVSHSLLWKHYEARQTLSYA